MYVVMTHNHAALSLHTQNVVEHVIVPQVQSLLLRYVQQEEKDARIKQQCLRYSDITMDQLHVKPAYQSPELEPFIDSISQLR